MNANTPVSQVMSKFPVFVTPETTIEHVHHLFEANNFHHLPVVDHGKLKGIISKTDYLKVQHVLQLTWNGKVSTQPVHQNICAGDIMSVNPLIIEPTDTVGLAADIFLSNKLHALPVIEDGELVGIVTSHDLLSYAYDMMSIS